MKELIDAINKECFSVDDVGGVGISGWVVEFDDVKELIETMLAGKVIVPVEPTKEMLKAGGDPIEYISITPQHQAKAIYKAMLSTIGEQE